MKNLLFTLVLLFSLHSFGQDNAHVSNPVSAVYIFTAPELNSFANAVVVPDGKFWTFNNNGGSFKFNLSTDGTNWRYVESEHTALPEGRKLWTDETTEGYYIIVYEHNLITETGLSSTNVELPNQIRLFPNPTTSKVALNSDKQYDIEVYDILGNKVMELTGNTIDMEHLSSATYIVNALDTETNERLSYKVIKN